MNQADESNIEVIKGSLIWKLPSYGRWSWVSIHTIMATTSLCQPHHHGNRIIMSTTPSWQPHHHVNHIIMSTTSSYQPHHHVKHIIMSSTHHQVVGKCNSSEACESTGENTLGRETLCFSPDLDVWGSGLYPVVRRPAASSVSTTAYNFFTHTHARTQSITHTQLWHTLTSTSPSRGRGGTWWHRRSFCVAGVALSHISLPHTNLSHTHNSYTELVHGQHCHTHNSFALNDVTNTQLCHTPLFHAQLFHTVFFTQLFHTKLLYTLDLLCTQIFHTQHCHTQLFHTTLSHPSVFHLLLSFYCLSHPMFHSCFALIGRSWLVGFSGPVISGNVVAEVGSLFPRRRGSMSTKKRTRL